MVRAVRRVTVLRLLARSLRQARLLGTADVVLHDADIPPAILDRSRADALRRTLPHDGPLPAGLTVILKRVEG